MPNLRINVTPGGTNSLQFQVPAGTNGTAEFYTTDNASVQINFTNGAPPFTDTANPFTVQGDPGVSKTLSPSATGDHDFTAGTRTGDIDITVSR